jgi:hypothetical protein
MHNKMVDPWSRQAFMAYEQKVIGVDFDETISDNTEGWLNVLLLLERIGYHVVIVTWRKPTEWPTDLDFLVDRGFKVYYTSRQAKKQYMEQQGIKVSIWIDDNPFAILHSQGD